MKIIIRDDDTCFFTEPEQLQMAYDFAGEGPISLSIVPHTVPRHSHFSEPFGEHPYKQYSFSDNTRLIEYLKRGIQEGKYDPLLHGYSHEYKQVDDQWIPEMLWKDEKQLSEEISAGKQELENLLQTEIRVFVAPSNHINQKGIRVLEQNHMNLSGIIGLHDRKLTAYSARNYIRRWATRAIEGIQYGGILDYGSHKELNAYTIDTYQRLVKSYEHCKKHGFPFCIYSHYWQLLKDQKEKDIVMAIYQYAMDDGAELVSLSSVLG